MIDSGQLARLTEHDVAVFSETCLLQKKSPLVFHQLSAFIVKLQLLEISLRQQYLTSQIYVRAVSECMTYEITPFITVQGVFCDMFIVHVNIPVMVNF